MDENFDEETRLEKARNKADHYLGRYQFTLNPEPEAARSFGILANLDKDMREGFFRLPEGQSEAVLSALIADFRRVQYWVGRVGFAEATVSIPPRVFDQLEDWSGLNENGVNVVRGRNATEGA